MLAAACVRAGRTLRASHPRASATPHMHSSYNPACNDGLEQDSHAPADGRVVTAVIHTYDSVTRGEAVMRLETRACATSRFAWLD